MTTCVRLAVGWRTPLYNAVRLVAGGKTTRVTCTRNHTRGGNLNNTPTSSSGSANVL